MTTLDIDFVRAQFPALSQPSLTGQAFFENAGGSYTSKFVIDRITRFYTERKVQPYAPYATSRIAGEEMDEARARLSAVLNIPADDLSFGPSTTQNIYVLSQAFQQMLSEGDAIVVTNQDHEANSGYWRRLEEFGIEAELVVARAEIRYRAPVNGELECSCSCSAAQRESFRQGIAEAGKGKLLLDIEVGGDRQADLQATYIAIVT